MSVWSDAENARLVAALAATVAMSGRSACTAQSGPGGAQATSGVAPRTRSGLAEMARLGWHAAGWMVPRSRMRREDRQENIRPHAAPDIVNVALGANVKSDRLTR